MSKVTQETFFSRGCEAALYVSPDLSAREREQRDALMALLKEQGYEACECELAPEEVMAEAPAHALYLSGQKYPIRGFANIKDFLVITGKKKAVLPPLPRSPLSGYKIQMILHDGRGSVRDLGMIPLQ